MDRNSQNKSKNTDPRVDELLKQLRKLEQELDELTGGQLDAITAAEGGTIIGASTIARDITERKQAEERARISDERYRRLFEATKDGLLILEAETGMVVDVNPFLIKLLGFSHEEFLGKKIWELGFFNDIIANPENFAEWQAKEYLRYDNMAIETSNGRRIEVEFTSNVYQVNDQKMIHCDIRDISYRRQAEEGKALNAVLEQRVAERTAELVAANKELEAFTYSVAHDLRAPLRAIDCFSRMVIDDCGAELDAEGRRQLNVIGSESRRMGQLIDELLSFSRLGRQEMKSATFDMTALAQSVFDDLPAAARQHVKEFRMHPLPPAHGDRAMIRQVLVNLIGNAVKYSAPNEAPVIEVSGETVDGICTYRVKDNGVGFDPRYAHKLFVVFQRLHAEHEFEGTGVGLAIVQRIVHRHGGTVGAEGALDQGATFSFSLPIQKPNQPPN